VVVKATVARAGQIAAATENSIAEPAPSTAETSAGSSLVHLLPATPVRTATCLLAQASTRAEEIKTSRKLAPFDAGAGRADDAQGLPCAIRSIGARAKMQFPIHPHMLRHGCGYALANATRISSQPTMVLPLPAKYTCMRRTK